MPANGSPASPIALGRSAISAACAAMAAREAVLTPGVVMWREGLLGSPWHDRDMPQQHPSVGAGRTSWFARLQGLFDSPRGSEDAPRSLLTTQVSVEESTSIVQSLLDSGGARVGDQVRVEGYRVMTVDVHEGRVVLRPASEGDEDRSSRSEKTVETASPSPDMVSEQGAASSS